IRSAEALSGQRPTVSCTTRSVSRKQSRLRSSVLQEVKLHAPTAAANSTGQPNGASMPTACDLAIISLSISSSQPRHGVNTTARSASQVIAQAAFPFGWEDISIPSVITAFIVSILPESDYRRRNRLSDLGPHL